MKSTNHIQPNNSSLPFVIDEEPQPMLRPHVGIWATRDRVELMFRLDGYASNHIVIDIPRDELAPMNRAREIAHTAALEMASNPSRRMTVKEVAAYLGKCASWVRRNKVVLGARRIGKNPKGGDLVFYQGDVEKGFETLARKVR